MGFLDFIFAPGEAQRSADLDKQLDDLNKAALERGRISRDEYDRRAQAINDSYVAPDAVGAEFTEELIAQGAAIPETIKATLEAPAGWIGRSIPWWAYVVAALYVLYYLGAFRAAKGSVWRALK